MLEWLAANIGTIIVALIVAFFVGMIVYGVIDSRKQKEKEASEAQQTEQTRDTTDNSSTSPSLITDSNQEVKDGDTVNIDYSGRLAKQ